MNKKAVISVAQGNLDKPRLFVIHAIFGVVKTNNIDMTKSKKAYNFLLHFIF